MTNLNPTLQDAAEDYLALRRSFGYRLRGHDVPLADLVRHLDQAGLHTVTVESAMAWAVEPVVSLVTPRAAPEHRPRIRHVPSRA
jgi:hypothetical protein